MLTIDPQALAAVQAHCEEAYPALACGVLVGRGGLGKRVAVATERARNRQNAEAGDRFEFHPLDYQKLDQGARSRGQDIVGVYHSHPGATAEPSRVDRETAWEGFSWLIIEVQDGKAGAFRSFEREDQCFEEERVEISDRAPPGSPSW